MHMLLLNLLWEMATTPMLGCWLMLLEIPVTALHQESNNGRKKATGCIPFLPAFFASSNTKARTEAMVLLL